MAARLLDSLVLGAAFAVLAGIAIAIVAPHVGKVFPTSNPDPNASTPTPGFVWIYLTLLGVGMVTGVLSIGYEGLATARYGRTLGKAWMRIRPVRTDGSRLGPARSFGRIALYAASGLVSWVGLLDPLWCLWDQNSQCVHDKAIDTIVIND